ncbi:MAG: Mrp/NBP35 family ATP-binding protein [Holophagales bacterium]|jgi:ATP-binding protein involved in chromosome partitioning|nr:Mrp/NBP35 family ATP-binding protein [Holophagales bacterium]
MSQKISRAAIFKALDTTIIHGSDSSLMAMKAIKAIDLNEGRVQISIKLQEKYKELESVIRNQLGAAILAISNVERLDLAFEWEGVSNAVSAETQNLLPTVKHIVVVGSGKGGVGKSTIAANLACVMARKGYQVGLMDADLYGPSIGMMFGVDAATGSPQISPSGTILPIEKYGLKLMSMGFLIDEDHPVIWRGPMLNKALNQFMTEVEWGDLDVLLIDLPPGTGDIQISLINSVNVGGAIIVSTPQDIAFLDAKKAIAMFRTVEVPILGVVENMSSFICPNCGVETPIFGRGGVRRAAQSMSLPFLGEIPIDMQIRTTSDTGAPIAAISPDSPQCRIFNDMAEKISEMLSL